MKTCSKCKLSLSLDNFTKNKSKTDGLNSYCKSCSKNYGIKYKKKNPTTYKDNLELRQKKRNFISNHKNIPCTDCGKSYPHYVMDFDHLYDKEFNISDSVRKMISNEKIEKEISKCEVVCANCHRERTFGKR
jgi:hypothetical protein